MSDCGGSVGSNCSGASFGSGLSGGSAHVIKALTCTPHFKYDVEDPYITKEGDSHIHCWFNPDKTQTLSQIAACIELQLLDEHQERMKQDVCACCYGPGEFTVTSMEIRGSTQDCQEMAAKITLECLSNEESFNITVRSNVTECVIL